ncbi:AmmeMemoRadiSam system protein A [Acidithiobacillus ferriphilus]|uniref:AmmeMemoRadiSam system protein A n=1 Tax=Acidithiobacillus ferriphilus TaxID=1689834 RepID=UPI001C0742F1|nr:AmmeMemoRadiSam system protein A [Acidithiobacillus ferriphilus]MBU2848959.1 AmmeMemoRadiSam system protein A [Acidithiobacillus ferriphilus]
MKHAHQTSQEDHPGQLPANAGPVLLGLARTAITEALGQTAAPVPAANWLRDPAASFVTLNQRGALRGCIGSLIAHRPLDEDIRANALAAAFHDPRFPPVSAAEWLGVQVEVSVLSPLERLAVRREVDLITQIQPGRHGLLLRYGTYQGTFLPQVWEELPDPKQFLSQLKRKAGLPSDFWSLELEVYRYHVEKWREPQAPAGKAT